MNGGTCNLPCRNETCWAPSRHFLIKQSYLGPLRCMFARVQKMQICVSVLVRQNDWPAFIAAASLEEMSFVQKILLKKNSKETSVFPVVPSPLFVHKYRSQKYGRKMFCLFSRGWNYGSGLNWACFCPCFIVIWDEENQLDAKLNSVALVRERTIPTERPPPVGEVSANFCG